MEKLYYDVGTSRKWDSFRPEIPDRRGGYYFFETGIPQMGRQEVHLAMAYFRMGDPLEDFQRLDRRQAQAYRRLPVCDGCCKAVTGETYYVVSGETLCCRCMAGRFLRRTEDFFPEEVG